MSEPTPDAPAPEAGTPGGPTPFLVDPADPHATVASLREAVRALIRERDYLREVRDVQLAEHEAEVARQRDRADEVQRLLEAVRVDRDNWKARAEALHEGVVAHRAQTVHHVHELAAQRLRTAELLREVAAHRARTTVVDGDAAANRPA